ncbi:MAG: PHP domain-containing protein [Umezawaea sp.]
MRDEIDRRRFLRGVGVLGATAAGVLGSTPTAAAHSGAYRWLVGDHHVHTQYSYDGMYSVEQQVAGALRHGVDWMVISDHGHASHERLSVEKIQADVVAARRKHPDLLLWHGMEWNVPGAEHGTLFFEDCLDEAAVFRDFERRFDWRLNGQEPSSPVNEAKALEAIAWLRTKIHNGTMRSAIVVVNHPSRNGRVAPHELRALRDAAPEIVIGMEGAPGAQGDGFPAPVGHGAYRGGYANAAGPNSWPGLPPEGYRTFGGFDWMTATLGGVWDSLLAEGRGWWITSNSDSHFNFRDTVVRVPEPGDQYDRTGKHLDAVDTGPPQLAAPYVDFFPGEFSRTVVGATRGSRKAVMEGLRAGRAWVCHGGLVDDLRFRIRSRDHEATLGERLRVRRGDDVTVRIDVRLAAKPNSAGFVPELARLDLIRGKVTGPTGPEAATNPDVAVARSFQPRRGCRRAEFRHTFRNVREPFYLRLRGTDGNRGGVEPQVDVVGQADPWRDLWTYTNPIFVDVR